MRRIWTTLPAALALSVFAIGGGFFGTRAHADDIQDAVTIMNGFGNMARNIGIGTGAARFGTNGVPLIVGGNFSGGGGYPGFAPQQYPQFASYPQPYYPPQPYYQPQPYFQPQPNYQPQPQIQYVSQPPYQPQNVIYSSGYSGYAPTVQYVQPW